MQGCMQWLRRSRSFEDSSPCHMAMQPIMFNILHQRGSCSPLARSDAGFAFTLDLPKSSLVTKVNVELNMNTKS